MGAASSAATSPACPPGSPQRRGQVCLILLTASIAKSAAAAASASSSKALSAASVASTCISVFSAKNAEAATTCDPSSVPLEDRLVYLESLFQAQSDKSVKDLEQLKNTLQGLAQRVGAELALRDLRYKMVDGRTNRAPCCGADLVCWFVRLRLTRKFAPRGRL